MIAGPETYLSNPKAPLWALMAGFLIVLLGLSALALKLKAAPALSLDNP